VIGMGDEPTSDEGGDRVGDATQVDLEKVHTTKTMAFPAAATATYER
jgi:hypothetical protein